ncbi:putative Integrase family protein [Nitrospira japonica]|uniref:Putative Integrase family protein n=1 Tax=Nitrospira japonica TaxID=1325564 RepID=A0A1W1I188_9BACT|nr:site-specific integrase [Nitrospira japonica]SLM46768.1 putative Integrase family protein [Nitrospira japonica]
MGLTKRKDSYYVEFPVLVDGKTLRLAPNLSVGKLKRWKVGCKNKEEARKQEAIIKTKLLQGMSTEVPTVPITVRDYCQRWLKSSKVNLAARTHSSYSQIVRLYIEPALGGQAVAALGWANVRAMLNVKQQAGCSADTTRIIRAVLSSMLTDAAEEGVIAVNPLLGQRRKRRAGQTIAPDVDPLTWQQKEAFETKLDELEESQSLSRSYTMLFRTYLKTGLRPSEGRALQPGDIDFVGRRVRVERSATLEGQIKSTKTGESRWVDLSDGILAELESYLTHLRAEDIARGKASDWLFPSLSGGLLDESHVVRAFHRVLDAAGLPRFRVYDLRHTFASLLLSSNVPLLYVSHQLGHTKPTITLKYYARWIPSGEVHRVNVLDAANTVITPATASREAATSLPT